MEELKARLEDLAESRFYLNMISHWTRKEFQKDDELFNEIKKIIEELKQLGIETTYHLGNKIEYKEV